MSGQREYGRCKNWFADRGFGFIRREDGSDIFVHVSQTGLLPLNAGDTVSFEVGQHRVTGKPEAKAVSVCVVEKSAAG
jgi:cold shock CspA family protein